MDDLKIRLVLEGAEQVQTSANKAADGLKKVGQAGQQAGQQAQLSGQQMAQVSAQLQDFFVQIQGGQAPLTALLQQGSQLSAVFGGVGNAVKAVASLITPAVAVLGTAAVTVGALTKAYADGSAEADAYARALVFSGSAAGVTVGQLQDLARAQAQVIGTQSQAATALTALAATGRVAGTSLDIAAEAAVRLARVGVPIEQTAKKFASLGKEPLKALVDLNEAENFLTVSVYKQIKALDERGRSAEAAAVAQGEYARVSIERAQQLEQRLGFLEKAWKSLGDGAKSAWDKILNIGRQETAQEALAKIEQQIGDAEKKLADARSGALGASRPFLDVERVIAARERELSGLRTEAAAKQEIIRLEKMSADRKRESVLATNGVIKADEDAAKAVGKLNAERERDAAALERAIGLTGSYGKDLAELVKLRERGALTEQQYVKAVEQVIKAQPMVREQLEAQAAAQKKAADALEDLLKAEQRRIDGLYKAGEQVAAHVLKLQEEEQALVLSVSANMSLAEAIERVTIARIEEAHAKATAANDMGTAAALRAEIEQREKLATLVGRKEAREAAKRGADDAKREWERVTGDIERSITDALLRGFESGKGFAVNLRDTLVNMFKTLVLRPILQPIVAQSAGGIASLLGYSGNALASTAAGSAGGIGQLGGLGSLLGLSGLGSAFSGGFGLALSGAGGTGLALQGAGSLLGSGAYGQAFGQAAGALAPWALGAGAGILGGRAISGGYSAFGGSGNAAVNIGTLAGAIFGGPIGAAIGGALGGVVNRAFGMKAKEYGDSGLTGMVTSDGFAGQAYADWLQKGGWFRSDKRGTDYSAVSTEQDAVLDAGVKTLYATTAEYAKALGLPVDAVKGYAASFKVAWGKTEEENQKAIQDAFVNLGEQLASRYAAALAPFQKAGETAAAALTRLSTLQTFSGSLNNLGGVFARVANSSFDAREQLIALAGGMDALSQQALGFAQNYYNRDEIAGLKARELQAALTSAGVTTDLNSREQFRALVEGLDPNSATGRQQLAALLQLQGSFATVADYLTESGLTLAQAAAQAPASDALLSPLLSTVGQQLQLAQQSMDAQYETRDAALQIVDAVKELTAAVKSGTSTGRVPGYSQPEVGLAY